jgi:ribonuclease-3
MEVLIGHESDTPFRNVDCVAKFSNETLNYLFIQVFESRSNYGNCSLIVNMAIPTEEIEKMTGHRFRNEQLLNQALTHRSADEQNNERLEFLGDSVLGLFVATNLFHRFPDCDEGTLTRCRAKLVRQETLAAAARRIRLGNLIVLGEGAARSGGADRSSILADVIEALIGAVYLEAGLAAAGLVVGKMLYQELRSIDPDTLIKDPKTELQERLQKLGRPVPKYQVKEERGAPHEREFMVECLLDGQMDSFLGKGASRQKAEQDAAKLALYSLEE